MQLFSILTRQAGDFLRQSSLLFVAQALGNFEKVCGFNNCDTMRVILFLDSRVAMLLLFSFYFDPFQLWVIRVFGPILYIHFGIVSYSLYLI